ncbi:hypothetical protein [Lysobacter sp. P5_B9]
MSEHFPRPVFDESGTYTISEAGAYEVSAPSIQRYHEVVFAIRDLRSAHEMVQQCCRDDLGGLHPMLEQGLWVGAVILYSKPFKRNGARILFDAGSFVRSHAADDMRDRHHYLITLRDKMIAHDDGLGECKQVSIGLPYRQPANHFEIGIDPPNPRVVSLGSDIAREVEPHIDTMLKMFEDYRCQLREKTVRDLFQSNLQEVTVLGRATRTRLEVNLDSVASRWPRGSGKS